MSITVNRVQGSAIISTFIMLLMNILQLFSGDCQDAAAICLVFTFALVIFEFPKLCKHCSTNCHKLYDQLNNKKTYLLKSIAYSSLSIGLFFIFNVYKSCWTIIVQGILILLCGISYSINFYIVHTDSKKDNKNKLNTTFNKFSSLGV